MDVAMGISNISMATSLTGSSRSRSFIDAQLRNRRRRYSISSPVAFESRAGTSLRLDSVALPFPLSNVEIDREEILSKLNVGKFGATYLMRDANDGHMYLLKRIDRSLPDEFRRRLFEERRLLACLQSNYILSLIAAYTDVAHQCFSMKFEYVTGWTLFDLVRRVRWLDESTVAFYSAQIVLAFEYLHESSIIYVRRASCVIPIVCLLSREISN